MKYHAHKLSEEQVALMKKKYAECPNYAKLGKEFGVRPASIKYRVLEGDEKRKFVERNRLNTKKSAQKPEAKEKHKAYLKKHPEIVAKSWLRHYLKKGILKKEDVLEVLGEFE